MELNNKTFNVLAFLLFLSQLAANGNIGSSPVIIEYDENAVPHNSSKEAQRILDEISVQEKIQFKSDTTKILNQSLNEPINNRANLPMLKYGAPVREFVKIEHVEHIVKYAPIMALYAVPSPDIMPKNP